MEGHGLDCCVAVGQRFATWLTGYHRYYGGISATVIEPDGAATLVVSPDEVPLAESQRGADHVVPFGIAGFGVQLDSQTPLLYALRSLPAVSRARRVGVAGMNGTGAFILPEAELVDVDDDFDRVSRVKDPDEVAKVSHSYGLCWRAQSAVESGAEAGASEIEMFTAALGAAQVGNGAPIEFVSDLLVGERTAEVCCPVAVAGERRPGPEDWVVADIALGAAGYWGDTCRTYLRPGSPDHVAEAVESLEVIKKTMASRLRPGAVAMQLHGEMAALIADAFPGGTFPHHGGHGIGLSGFEYPHLIPSDDSVVEADMILALEPGVYFPGRFGARVEQLFLVTADGGLELASVKVG